MNIEMLKKFLDIKKRGSLFNEILSKFKKFSEREYIEYQQYQTSEGVLPCLFIKNKDDAQKVKYLKIFTAAQHNEYNGLFGILKFFEKIEKEIIKIKEILEHNQEIVFFPILNPYGFNFPLDTKKSGYYLKNGTNLNRFWRRTFVPNFTFGEGDAIDFPIPKNAQIFRDVIQNYWENEEIAIYLLDFHETSLLERFTKELIKNFECKSITYKFNHWLLEGIILNIIKLYNIPYYRKPLFYKCNESADHTHINLSIKQIKTVDDKLREYVSENYGKLQFYFCYGEKSKKYCEKLAQTVYKKLKNILWKTYYPAFNHYFHDHGCFVKMGDATNRERVFTMELESKKHFYDIIDEVEKSKKNPNYFKNKLASINQGETLALESIIQMIKLF